MAKPKILFADNNLEFLEDFTKYTLGSQDYEIFKAETPERAREILEDNLIHLAIVDVRLRHDPDPNDRSGLHLCEQMDPTVARIILTGHTDQTNSWQLVREASKPTLDRHRLADGFFSKVEDPKLIIDEIGRVLQEEFEIIPERRIAVLTSGGDSPGMNAAIWAVVRTAINNDIEVLGVQDGYKGLVADKMRKLRWNEVSNIMEKSGTILGAARFPDFSNTQTRQKAINNISRKHVSGLIVIGGDGSMKGAEALARDLQQNGKLFQTVAIPGTIDNDLLGTDMSLGAASAANAMIEEMRNMIQPARALRRIFVCEVMGACSGYLALQSALGVAADAVIIPENLIETISATDPTNPLPWKTRIDINKTEEAFRKQLEAIAKLLEGVFAANKGYGFVVMAEGVRILTEKERRLDARYVKEFLTAAIRLWSQSNVPDVRVQELGYIVRGVPPSRFDIWLGARLGAAAVQCLLKGDTNIMVGWKEGAGIIETPFAEVVAMSNRPPKEIWEDRAGWKETLELQEALACPPKLRGSLTPQDNRFIHKYI